MTHLALVATVLLSAPFAIAGPISSGGADPYLDLHCQSVHGDLKLTGDVGPSCAHEVKLSGAVNEVITQTCTSSLVSFVYSELARPLGKVIVSGDSGTGTFHLISKGKIQVKALRSPVPVDEALKFTADFIYSSRHAGKRTTVVRELICTAESFDEP